MYVYLHSVAMTNSSKAATTKKKNNKTKATT